MRGIPFPKCHAVDAYNAYRSGARPLINREIFCPFYESTLQSQLTVGPRLEAAVIAHAPRPTQAPGHPDALRRTAPALLAKVVVVTVREAVDVGGGDAGGLLVAVVAERKVAGVRLDAARLRH